MLNAAAGKESFAIDRQAPFEATFQGRGLSCEVFAATAIEVELAKGGSRSVSSTSGGQINVNVGS